MQRKMLWVLVAVVMAVGGVTLVVRFERSASVDHGDFRKRFEPINPSTSPMRSSEPPAR